MSDMFQAATSFDGDLSSFDTRKVTTMEAMFRDAASYSGKGLESFDTSKVISMERMFFGASSLQGSGMADWNIQKVENMDNMVRTQTCYVYSQRFTFQVGVKANLFLIRSTQYLIFAVCRINVDAS